jgi:hypothetical protein
MSSFEESPAVPHHGASDGLDFAPEALSRLRRRDRASQAKQRFRHFDRSCYAFCRWRCLRSTATPFEPKAQSLTENW